MRYSCMPCNPVAVGVISTKRPNFRTVGLLHSSCLVVASSTKVSCGRNRARMTNTSRNGIGAKRSRAISVSHWAHALGLPLPTRKFFSRACASSMEAICCPATQLCSSISNSLSGRRRLDTNKLIAPSQSSLVIAVSKRIQEAKRMGAAIRSRRGTTAGCVSFRVARLTLPVGSWHCSQCQ